MSRRQCFMWFTCFRFFLNLPLLVHAFTHLPIRHCHLNLLLCVNHLGITNAIKWCLGPCPALQNLSTDFFVIAIALAPNTRQNLKWSSKGQIEMGKRFSSEWIKSRKEHVQCAFRAFFSLHSVSILNTSLCSNYAAYVYL